MKVLFLDVDGVLNGRDTKEREPETGYIGVDDWKCALLRKIVGETGCAVVLSSTWRKNPKMLPYLYGRLGFMEVIIGMTPVLDEKTPSSRLYRGHTRGDEIKAWLKDHPEVKDFVILDDDPCMGDLAEHCVHTITSVGLTPELAAEVICRLSKHEVALVT